MFKIGQLVAASRDITEGDVNGEDDPTVVIQANTQGIVTDSMTEDSTMYDVNFKGFGTLWVLPNMLKIPFDVSHVAKRTATLFDNPNPLKRKVIGSVRELYRAEVLETVTEPLSRETYYRIKLLDGAFAEAMYAGDIWTRAWQWRKIKPGEIDMQGNIIQEKDHAP